MGELDKLPFQGDELAIPDSRRNPITLLNRYDVHTYNTRLALRLLHPLTGGLARRDAMPVR